jgi:hypothetical protein
MALKAIPTVLTAASLRPSVPLHAWPACGSAARRRRIPPAKAIYSARVSRGLIPLTSAALVKAHAMMALNAAMTGIPKPGAVRPRPKAIVKDLWYVRNTAELIRPTCAAGSPLCPVLV